MTEKNWIEQMMEAKWFLVEKQRTVINDTGYPSTYYEAYISTSPHEDKVRSGYRLATIQRWFGPNYNGEIEQLVGRHLVDLHNASLGVKPAEPQLLTENIPEKKERKKRELTPEQRQKMVENFWPKGLPRLKHPDGRPMKKKEVLEFLKNEKQKTQETSVGVVQEGQPVQTENSQEPSQVHSEDQTQEKKGPSLVSSAGLYE